MSGSALSFTYRGPFGASAALPGLSLSYWLRVWDLSIVQELKRANAQHIANNPEGFCLVTAFRTSSLDPRGFADDRVREELASMLRATTPYIRCSAIVLDGGGFIAATLRSATMGLSLLTRSKVRQHFFSTGSEAVAFLAKEGALSPPQTLGALQSAFDEVRTEALNNAAP